MDIVNNRSPNSVFDKAVNSHPLGDSEIGTYFNSLCFRPKTTTPPFDCSHLIQIVKGNHLSSKKLKKLLSKVDAPAFINCNTLKITGSSNRQRRLICVLVNPSEEQLTGVQELVSVASNANRWSVVSAGSNLVEPIIGRTHRNISESEFKRFAKENDTPIRAAGNIIFVYLNGMTQQTAQMIADRFGRPVVLLPEISSAQWGGCSSTILECNKILLSLALNISADTKLHYSEDPDQGFFEHFTVVHDGTHSVEVKNQLIANANLLGVRLITSESKHFSLESALKSCQSTVSGSAHTRTRRILLTADVPEIVNGICIDSKRLEEDANLHFFTIDDKYTKRRHDAISYRSLGADSSEIGFHVNIDLFNYHLIRRMSFDELCILAKADRFQDMLQEFVRTHFARKEFNKIFLGFSRHQPYSCLGIQLELIAGQASLGKLRLGSMQSDINLTRDNVEKGRVADPYPKILAALSHLPNYFPEYWKSSFASNPDVFQYEVLLSDIATMSFTRLCESHNIPIIIDGNFDFSYKEVFGVLKSNFELGSNVDEGETFTAKALLTSDKVQNPSLVNRIFTAPYRRAAVFVNYLQIARKLYGEPILSIKEIEKLAALIKLKQPHI